MSKPFCASKGVPAAGSVRPYTVGITGSRGTGKSAVGDILQKQHGAEVVDTDHITHELLNGPCEAYNEVLARFGNDLVTEKDGPINRKLLGARAFETAEAKAALEAIMFPRINERLEEHLIVRQNAGVKVFFVLVPLLHEAGMKDYFDEVWCVVANEDVRLNRLMLRDGLTAEEAKRLIALQMSQTAKANLSDHLIDNSWDIEKTAELVKGLVDELMKRVEQHLATATPQPASPAESGDGTTGEPTAPAGDGTGETAEPAGDETQGEPTGDQPEGESDGDQPEGGASDDANKRYRRHLRRAAEIGTDEVLDELGNIAETQDQEANAKLTLSVDRVDGGKPTLQREFDVEVTMRARNKPGKPPEPDCKKPSPTPGPGQGDCNGNKRDRLWLVVLGFFGLLAFLFACVMLWMWHNHNPDIHNGGNKQEVTIINNIPGCNPCTPVVPPKDPPIVIVEPPVTPPTPPTAPCNGAKQELGEVPGFAFRFVHNAVRVNVTKWEVTYRTDCTGASVAGFDANNKLLVYQEYDTHHYMTFQYVMSYYPDGAIQVDRFEGRQNIYTGRSIYRTNQVGSVVRAEQFDAKKRLIYVVTFVRTGGGGTVSLNVEPFNPDTGAPTIKRTIEGPDAAAEFMRTQFYVFRWFGQL